MYNNITEEMIKIKENCFVNQTSNNDCGLACLTMILKYYGVDENLNDIKKKFKYSDEKVSVYDLVKLSNEKGILATGYKNVSLTSIKVPCIAHLVYDEKQHFVVIIKILKNKILVADPARRIMYIDKNSFLKKYTGVAILFEEKEKNNSFILKNKSIILKSIFLSFIFTLFSVLYSFMIPLAVKNINTGKKSIIIFSFSFLIIGLLKNIIGYVKSSFSVKLQLFIDKFITIPVINKIISLPHLFFYSNGSGNLITKINDLSYIKDTIFNFIEVILLNIILIIVVIILMLFNDWFIALINIPFILLIYLINHIFISKNLYKSYDLQSLNEKINNNLMDTFTSILTIKNLAKEEYFKRKINNLYETFLNKYHKLSLLYQKKELLTSSFITFFNILLLTIFILKNYSVTRIILMFSFETILIDAILEINKFLPLYSDFKSAKQRIMEISNKKELLSTNDNILINNIFINKLTFKYNNKIILKDITLNINKGDWIMVLGPTGSGKSTLFKLLTKQINYNGSNIFINKINISNIKEEVIRNSITYVDQKIKLINDSIKENIFMGDKVDNSVLKNAMVHSILKEKNTNYNYVIDNTSSNISAGQASIIAIAQALNSNKDFIIFDETTSSLDVSKEDKILNNIKQNYPNKTIILITHRKTNIKYFNRIITFKNKGILEVKRRENEKIIN